MSALHPPKVRGLLKLGNDLAAGFFRAPFAHLMCISNGSLSAETGTTFGRSRHAYVLVKYDHFKASSLFLKA